MTSRLRIDLAARYLLAGGVIAYPTEAVYGIGCIPDDADALQRIIRLKRRDASKGLIVVAATVEQASRLALLPQGDVGRAVVASWPGPVTWVLPARDYVPSILTGGRSTIAVRVSAHPVVQQLCLRTDSPLVSTSANYSGRRPARTALAVRRQFGNELDYVLAGSLGEQKSPTEIRDAATGRVLRAS